MSDQRKVWLTLEQFDALDDYSCSVPTGTTIGKKWRRRVPYEYPITKDTRWYQGQYVHHSDPGKVGIQWSLIERVDGQHPATLFMELGRGRE